MANNNKKKKKNKIPLTTRLNCFNHEIFFNLPEVRAGDKIKCPLCGKVHILFGLQAEYYKGPTDVLLQYECNGKIKVAALHGRLIRGTLLKTESFQLKFPF